MENEQAEAIIELLTSIDTKLDNLESLDDRINELHNLIFSIKQDVSGFEHNGQTFPSGFDRLEAALNAVETELSSQSSTLDAVQTELSSQSLKLDEIERNTSHLTGD